MASDQPPARVDPATYRRGRRAHWRRVVAGSVLGTLSVVGTTAALPLLERGFQPSPATGDDAAALPSRIYAVPERLAEHIGHPEGYRWHPDVAVSDLAIGTTAAVFPVNEGAVAAVSAVDGSYRGLDLPDFDEAGFHRFGGPPVVLSPDGNRLAYTWHPDVTEGGDTPGYEPSGVRIVDLRTGRIRSFRIREGFGVYARGFSWSPNGHYLAYSLHVTTRDGSGGIRGLRNFRAGRLDTSTGRHTEASGLPQIQLGAAVSNRGEMAAVGSGRPATWLPGRRPVVRSFVGGVDEWTAAWSPDGRRLAAGSYEHGWFSVGAPSHHGLVTGTAADAPSGSSVRVVGWVDDERVALMHHDADDADVVVSVVPAGEKLGGPGRRLIDLEPTTGLGNLSIATGLLDRPTRDFPEPDWPTDWGRVLTWSGVGLLALVIIGPPAYARRRARDEREPPDQIG